jgi:hypothetical protein
VVRLEKGENNDMTENDRNTSIKRSTARPHGEEGAAPPPAPPTVHPPIARIHIRQREGMVGSLVHGSVLTVEAADALVGRIRAAFVREHPTGNCGYWKTDVRIEYDGVPSEEVRLDINELTGKPFAARFGQSTVRALSAEGGNDGR